MYQPEQQYRCTIIRGKSKKDMDDLLPVYAQVIDEVCPCRSSEFEVKFNQALLKLLPETNCSKKTLDNHRTEIAGQLFGMFFHDKQGLVFASERTKKYLADGDQPAFFKDLCFKLQFPNGSQKITTTLKDRLVHGVNLLPNSFLLQVLLEAEQQNIYLSVREVGFYILNALHVLQGEATPDEVLATIIEDRQKQLCRTIDLKNKKYSFAWQHIHEILNYLELANLLNISKDKFIYLNKQELTTIYTFAENWCKKPDFDVYSFDLSTPNKRKIFQLEWEAYFGKLSLCARSFDTDVKSLIPKPNIGQNLQHSFLDLSLVEIGEEGENLVFSYERERVASFNPALVNKVVLVNKIKGLGYDIKSIVAKPGEKSEFNKMIEVKSTKRVTTPNFSDKDLLDSFNLTRSEWIAAMQYDEYYSIYRVYFTAEGVFVVILDNPHQKIKDNQMNIKVISYQIDFTQKIADNCFKLK